MSTNIHIVGKRTITFFKGDGTLGNEVQTQYLDVWQTPTKVTYAIMNTADRIQAYKDWVVSQSHDVQEKVYANDDLFCEGDPIGFLITNEGRVHIARLEDEIAKFVEDGFRIEVESW